MKNHVFIIQAHAYPALLSRMVRRLSAPNHYFIIHIDAKADIHPFCESIGAVDNVFFAEKRIVVNHGGFSQIECTVNMLREIVERKIPYDYVHLLSGQDYPIVTNEMFDAFFEKGTNSYMHFDSEEEHQQWKDTKYKERYMYYHYNDYPCLSTHTHTHTRRRLNCV